VGGVIVTVKPEFNNLPLVQILDPLYIGRIIVLQGRADDAKAGFELIFLDIVGQLQEL